MLKLLDLKLKKKLSEKSRFIVTKLFLEESSLNKINAELFLKFKSTEYFCETLSSANINIFELIISITLNV